MTRSDVLSKIDSLLTQKCKKCPIRAEMVKKYEGQFSRQDGYCNKNCTVGTELQMLGKML